MIFAMFTAENLHILIAWAIFCNDSVAKKLGKRTVLKVKGLLFIFIFDCSFLCTLYVF